MVMGQDMAHRQKVYATYSSVSGLNQPLQSKYQSLARNLTPHLKQATGKLLDIGSGQGEMLELCRDLDLDAEGIDVSVELVQSCISRGLNVTLIRDLPFFLKACSRQYALVSMIDVLEHLTKTEAFEVVDLIHSYALQTNGKLIVQVPNMQSPFAALNLYHDLTHEWSYTEASLTQLLKSVGFKKVQAYPQEYPMSGLYIVRHVLRTVLYSLFRAMLAIDQPNRGKILTPNLIAVAEV